MGSSHSPDTVCGGDFLTAERARGAQPVRSNTSHDFDQLKGLLSVSEDWHAKRCFLSVSFYGFTCKTLLQHSTSYVVL